MKLHVFRIILTELKIDSSVNFKLHNAVLHMIVTNGAVNICGTVCHNKSIERETLLEVPGKKLLLILH